MGTRLNVASTYKIEYAPCSYFNHLMKEVNLKLRELFDLYCHDKEDYIFFDDVEAFPYSDSIEINKHTLKKIINRLKELDPNEPCIIEEDDSTNIYTVEDFRNALSYLYDYADSELDYVKLEWF